MIPRRPIRLVIGLTIAALFLPVFPTAAQSIKEDPMILHRNGTQPSQKGPAESFTGTVRIDPLKTAPAPARHGAASVTFEPGARSAWHTHPLGQTLVVTSGVGWTQCEGEAIVEIRVSSRSPKRHAPITVVRLGVPVILRVAVAGNPCSADEWRDDIEGSTPKS